MEEIKVPYKVYESEQARAAIRLKYMRCLALMILSLLIGTNAGWLIYEAIR